MKATQTPSKTKLKKPAKKAVPPTHAPQGKNNSARAFILTSLILGLPTLIGLGMFLSSKHTAVDLSLQSGSDKGAELGEDLDSDLGTLATPSDLAEARKSSVDSSETSKQGGSQDTRTDRPADTALAGVALGAGSSNPSASEAGSPNDTLGNRSQTGTSGDLLAKATKLNGLVIGSANGSGSSSLGGPVDSLGQSKIQIGKAQGETSQLASAEKSQKNQNNALLTQKRTLAQKGCFELTFEHKKLGSHSNGQACLKHKNLITLKHPDLGTFARAKSVCVEVNGEQVKHQSVPGKADQILIGPYAGPNATIVARACVDQGCQVKCAAMADDFMGALGMGQTQEIEGPLAVQWDGSNEEGKEEKVLKKELKSIDHLVSMKPSQAKHSVFSNWIVKSFRNLSCLKGEGYDVKHIEVSQRR